MNTRLQWVVPILILLLAGLFMYPIMREYLTIDTEAEAIAANWNGWSRRVDMTLSPNKVVVCYGYYKVAVDCIVMDKSELTPEVILDQ